MSVMEVIEGISKKDLDKVERMMNVEAACDAAGVPTPYEVEEYLELEHEIVSKLRPGIDKGVTVVDSNGRSVVEIDLSKIDKKIDIIRITKSW